MLHGIVSAATEQAKLSSVATFLQHNYMSSIKVIHGGLGAEHALLGSKSLKLMEAAATLPQFVGETLRA